MFIHKEVSPVTWTVFIFLLDITEAVVVDGQLRNSFVNEVSGSRSHYAQSCITLDSASRLETIMVSYVCE